MKLKYKKKNLIVSEIRRFIEPDSIILLSSKWRGKTNIMTLGWHTVLEFLPSLIGCVIAENNHTYKMVVKSKECMINIPEVRWPFIEAFLKKVELS